MKVLSVIQPWATLIAIGEKAFETRSWSTKYRGPLAIHASKKIDTRACQWPPFRDTLAEHGYDFKNLPTGAIVATCRLVECHEVLEDYGVSAYLSNRYRVTDHEYAFGDYSPGRYAWELADRVFLEEPIPAKGQLGLWEYPIEHQGGAPADHQT